MARLITLVILVSCLAAAAYVESTPYADSDDANIEDLARLVCKTSRGTKNQLSKFSSITGVIGFLSSLSDGHQLFDCRIKYLEALKKLAQVVETASSDVCGDEKLALIEDFHRKYVSKVTRHEKEQQRRADKAPTMAKLFFMEYVNQVSSVCEQSALKSLSSGDRNSVSEEELSNLNDLKRFIDALGLGDLSQGFKGTYLFWNMVDSLALAENDKFAKYLTDGGETRINVQVKDAKSLNNLQALCRYRMRPFYSKTLLPVIRLADLGYYPAGNQLSSALNSNPRARGQYYALQICEILMPIAVFSDNQLAEDQFVAVRKEEANKLSQPEIPNLEEIIRSIPRVDIEPQPIKPDELSFGGVSVETIKSNVQDRSKIINRLLKQLWQNVKSKVKSSVKGMKLFHRSHDQTLKPILDSDLDHLSDDRSLQIIEVDDAQTSRKRRGIMSKIFWFVIDIFLTIYYIVSIIVKIPLTVPVAILGLLFGHPQEFLDALWLDDPVLRLYGKMSQRGGDREYRKFLEQEAKFYAHKDN